MRTPELRQEGTTKYKKIKSCLQKYGKGIITALGGLFYFFGDNFSPLVFKYAEELYCDEGCIFRAQTAGIIILGFAIITYLPILINPDAPNAEQDNMIPGSLLLVTKITNLDLVYTAIERAASNDCDKVLVGSWIYWSIYIFVFTVTSVIQSYVSHKKKAPQPIHIQYTKGTEEIDERTSFFSPDSWTRERTRSQKFYYTICAIIPGVFISLFAASYILADNRLPLACTGSAKDISSRSKVWVGLWAFAFVNLAMFGVWYMCKRCWHMCEKW